VAVALAVAFGGNVATTTPILASEKVTMAYLPVTHALPLFVALEEKMFEAEGIEPEAVKMENPNLIIDSFISGRSDIGPLASAAGITVIASTRFPGTMKVFGLQGGNPTGGQVNESLIVPADSAIESFADLKGKRMAHLPGIQWKTISRFIIQKNGLDPDKDVTLQDLAVPNWTQALLGGTVDAVLALEPVASMAAANDNIKVVVVNPTALFIADPFWAGASVITTKFMKERPSVAKKTIAVIDKATRMVEDDFKKYAPLLAKYTAVPQSAIPVVGPVYWRTNTQIEEKDIVAYQAFADIFHDAGVIKAHLDVRTIMLQPDDLK
ncbi:MAG: ABC transporter substrate-binding protein, partial [Paracoccaceae bacterium]